MLTISIDAMGGDHGPDVVVSGVERAVKLLGSQSVFFCSMVTPNPYERLLEDCLRLHVTDAKSGRARRSSP